MEQRREIEWSSTVYSCDKCLLDMVPTGIIIDTDFRQYPHKCSNGHTQRLEFPYPRLSYRVSGRGGDEKWKYFE